MKRFLLAWGLALGSVAGFALPSVEAVQAELQQGHYAQAEGMLREVVQAKPGSAKAHYVYAEVLAHNGRFEMAAAEARLAQQIEPDLHFTQPEKFRAFEQLLEREQRVASSPGTLAQAGAPSQRSSGVPGWVWGLGFAGLAVLIWRLMVVRSQGPVAMPAPAAAGYPPGYAPGYAPMGGMPSAGSGMLGTGLAAAGGFAAGMLAEKLFDGGHEARTSGLVPGMFDDAPMGNEAATQLEQRSIDFGNGDDWGGGGGDALGGDSW